MLAGGTIGDEETDVFRRVPGSVQHREPHIADADHITLNHLGGAIVHRVAIAPVRRAAAAQEELRAGAERQLARAAAIVSVNVRFSDRGDTHPFALGKLDVLIDVAQRVHHHRLVGGLAPDEVARL